MTPDNPQDASVTRDIERVRELIISGKTTVVVNGQVGWFVPDEAMKQLKRIIAALNPQSHAREIERLRKALGFYAAQGVCPHAEGIKPVCIWDDGDHAKAALRTPQQENKA
jgi:hypothetical protein